MVDPGDGRPRLDVATLLAARHAALYWLSKEGEGSAGAPLSNELSNDATSAVGFRSRLLRDVTRTL